MLRRVQFSLKVRFVAGRTGQLIEKQRIWSATPRELRAVEVVTGEGDVDIGKSIEWDNVKKWLSDFVE
jgi:hypothetical protein